MRSLSTPRRRESHDVTGNAESFGPYTFTLSPAETAAVAARSSLRAAIRDALEHEGREREVARN